MRDLDAMIEKLLDEQFGRQPARARWSSDAIQTSRLIEIEGVARRCSGRTNDLCELCDIAERANTRREQLRWLCAGFDDRQALVDVVTDGNRPILDDPIGEIRALVDANPEITEDIRPLLAGLEYMRSTVADWAIEWLT